MTYFISGGLGEYALLPPPTTDIDLVIILISTGYMFARVFFLDSIRWNKPTVKWCVSWYDSDKDHLTEIHRQSLQYIALLIWNINISIASKVHLKTGFNCYKLQLSSVLSVDCWQV